MHLDAAPENLNSNDGNLSGFTFYGNTSPFTLVNLYIFSTPLVKTTTSDANGDWKITVTEPFENGVHKIYAVKVVGGQEVKNSNIISFSVDSSSKIVAMDEPVSPNSALGPNPLPETGSQATKKDNNNIVFWGLGFVVLLSLTGGIIFFYKKNKKNKRKLD